MSERPSRAWAEHQFERMGVNIHVSPRPGQVFSFDPVIVHTYDESSGVRPDATPLFLPEPEARAVYEALADYFGHSGHDTRALRRDYEAERQRVDTFIAHLTKEIA